MKTITSLVLILGASNAYRLRLRDEPTEDKEEATDKPAAVPSGPTDSTTQAFTELETGIAQGQRNVSQGAIGRQLGLTKVVKMKMTMKNLRADMEK